MAKFLRWFLLPPIALAVIALSVANRHIVTLSFDPFDPEQPALGFDLPLAAIIFFALLIGILIGGFAAWGQARRKKRSPISLSSTGTNMPIRRSDS